MALYWFQVYFHGLLLYSLTSGMIFRKENLSVLILISHTLHKHASGSWRETVFLPFNNKTDTHTVNEPYVIKLWTLNSAAGPCPRSLVILVVILKEESNTCVFAISLFYSVDDLSVVNHVITTDVIAISKLQFNCNLC